MKIGLALSGGGARGFAHVGVIKVLQKHKIPVHCIAGTSMGAMVAAYYALHLDVKGLEDAGLKFKKKDLLKLIDVNNPKISLVKGKKAKDFMKRFFGNKTFKDTKIPLSISTTSLEDGSEVVFTRGKLINAVMASGTIPGVFPPVKYNGKTLVDGGFVNATPVSLVKKMGADVIIAVDLLKIKPLKKSYKNAKDVLARSYEISISNLSDYKEKDYGKNIVVLKPETGSRIQTFAFHRAKKFIKAGEIEAEKNIRKIKKLIK